MVHLIKHGKPLKNIHIIYINYIYKNKLYYITILQLYSYLQVDLYGN